jgi:predicted lipoprotein with Yx(FWY)xxD motif
MSLDNLRFKVIACALILSACGALQLSSAPVKFADGVLVNNAGMTLYTFDKDSKGKSACVDQCASNWPPLKASAEDKPGRGFSIVSRDDGSKQWAYDDKPLYLWVKDQKPGDKTGDGVNKTWHVVAEPAKPDSSGGGGY